MMRGFIGKIVRGGIARSGGWRARGRCANGWCSASPSASSRGSARSLFYTALEWATKLLIGGIAGYYPPKPAGEGATVVQAIRHRWLIPVVTTLGALIGNLIVFSFAPEAEGHGTDAAIDSFHHKGGQVRPRIPPIKLIASAITIGSGGSGGREGPAAQISAGFGSLLATWMRLDTRDRRIAVATGMGAGIGAIFRAPLGGAVMAAEILYLHDLEVEALIPSLIASITGYSIFGAFFGWSPVFGNQTGLDLQPPDPTRLLRASSASAAG